MISAEIERLNDLLDDNECRLSHDGGHGHHEIEENAYREMWALAKRAVTFLREAGEPDTSRRDDAGELWSSPNVRQ